MSEENTFGGFKALGDMISDPEVDFQTPGESGDDAINIPSEDDKIVEEEEIVDPSALNNDDVVEPTSEEDVVEPANTNNEDADDISGLGELEPDIAAYVQEKLFERYGWEVDENDPKFDSMDKVVEFLNNVVEENSKPVFASKEIDELNKFVSNGGNIESYLQQRYDGNVDLEKLDITNSTNQNLVLREFFKEQGYDSSKIEKRLQRYEDTGIKEEEAREAYDIIKRVRKEKSDSLLVMQEKQKEQSIKQQQDFFNNVNSNIESIKDIRGIPLAPNERKQLTDYIFKPLPNGKTAYQKDYESSVNNLIESAYFTMKGDKLLNKMSSKATSTATKKLRDALSTNTKRSKNTSLYNDEYNAKGDHSLLTGLGGSLYKPQF